MTKSFTRVERPSPPGPLSNALTFGWRAVLKFKHVPEQLFDLVMTPIMFTLLFTFVFGGALAGSTGNYLQYLLPGILVQTVLCNAVYSGMGLSKRLFDRCGSLPIWSLAPFARLFVGDFPRHMISGGIILGIGLALGYRADAGPIGVVGAFLVLLAVGFGFGWCFIVLRLLVRTPTTVMTLGFTVLFPLVFASNVMVDPATMPGWLEAFVRANPVTWIVTAVQGVMDGTVTAGAIGLALLAPAVLALILMPLSLRLYRRS